MICQLTGQIDSCRAVSTTDDTDGCSFLSVESQSDSCEKCEEDTELCSSTHDQGFRVCDQRSEVRHGTYSQEDQGRQDRLHQIEDGQYPGF